MRGELWDIDCVETERETQMRIFKEWLDLGLVFAVVGMATFTLCLGIVVCFIAVMAM